MRAQCGAVVVKSEEACSLAFWPLRRSRRQEWLGGWTVVGGEGGKWFARSFFPLCLCLPSRVSERARASRWGPLHPSPRMPRSLRRWGREKRERERKRERREREREWAMILTHCLGARQAGAPLRTPTSPSPNSAGPSLPVQSVVARARSLALSRRLSWDFFSTTTTTFIAGRSKSVSLFRGAEIGGEREKQKGA